MSALSFMCLELWHVPPFVWFVIKLSQLLPIMTHIMKNNTTHSSNLLHPGG